MTSLTPCPDSGCRATGPHEHRALGEGLFAPPVHERRSIVAPDDPETTQRIGDLVSTATIPLVCPKCGARWEGPAFTKLKPGEWRRPRICAACAPAPQETVTPIGPPNLTVERVVKAPRRLGARELAPEAE